MTVPEVQPLPQPTVQKHNLALVFAHLLSTVDATRRPQTTEELKRDYVVFRSMVEERAKKAGLQFHSKKRAPSDVLSSLCVLYRLSIANRETGLLDYGTFKCKNRHEHQSVVALCPRSAQIDAIFPLERLANGGGVIDAATAGKLDDGAVFLQSIGGLFQALAPCQPHQVPVLALGQSYAVTVPCAIRAKHRVEVTWDRRGQNNDQLKIEACDAPVAVSAAGASGQQQQQQQYLRITLHARAAGHHRFVITGRQLSNKTAQPLGHPDIQVISVRVVHARDVETIRELSASAPYIPRKRTHRPATATIIEGPPLPALAAVKPRHPMKAYEEPGDYENQIVEIKAQHAVHRGDVPAGKEFLRNFKYLLHMEERQMNQDIRDYDLENTQLEFVSKRLMYKLHVAGLAEKRPSVLVGDKIYVLLRDKPNAEFEGTVFAVNQEDVDLRFSPLFSKAYIAGMRVSVRFSFSRACLRRAHRGIEFLGNNSHFNAWMRPSKKSLVQATTTIDSEHFTPPAFLNEQQRKAVMNVARGVSGNVPFVIFGPPGTGKTTTLCETIYGYTRCHPAAKILVCAPSNNAADVLVSKLSQHFSPSEMFRVNAYHRTEDSFTNREIVLKYSRSSSGGFFELPTAQALRDFRIIVSTCYSGCLPYGIGIHDMMGKGQAYFDAIFVDEAGHAHEPEFWSGVACYLGQLTVGSGKLPQLVLAGDPKQLGAMVRSRVATALKLDLSYLERLLTWSELHTRDPTSGFDERFVVKLVDNYRSHPSILRLPSDLFYDGELVACANVRERSIFERWEALPNAEFPVLFHGVRGKDEREANSPSWFNADELVLVSRYVEDVLRVRGTGVKSSDIAVITPYRKQCAKMRKLLQRSGHDDILAGTVEQLQGGERTVIIISTVRSTPDYLSTDRKFNLGFIFSPKRFNVAITRAKALLIIVGNPDVLVHDPNWLAMLRYIHTAGNAIGAPIDFSKAASAAGVDASLTSMSNAMAKIELGNGPATASGDELARELGYDVLKSTEAEWTMDK